VTPNSAEQSVKRTEGVSTTDLVGRMLMKTKEHHSRGPEALSPSIGRRASDCSEIEQPIQSSFLTTTRRITQFSENKAPKPSDKVVYVDGAFDLFHAGHIRFLKKARSLGDFLIVGLHSDAEVNKYRGDNLPIANLHERTLGVLSCRHVDEVIIGAPWEVTQDMIKTLNIQVVATGTHWQNEPDSPADAHPTYAVPRELGMLTVIPSDSKLSTRNIVDRILRNRGMFETKFEKKAAAEQEYYQQKTYRQEG